MWDDLFGFVKDAGDAIGEGAEEAGKAIVETAEDAEAFFENLIGKKRKRRAPNMTRVTRTLSTYVCKTIKSTTECIKVRIVLKRTF